MKYSKEWNFFKNSYSEIVWKKWDDFISVEKFQTKMDLVSSLKCVNRYFITSALSKSNILSVTVLFLSSFCSRCFITRDT